MKPRPPKSKQVGRYTVVKAPWNPGDVYEAHVLEDGRLVARCLDWQAALTWAEERSPRGP